MAKQLIDVQKRVFWRNAGEKRKLGLERLGRRGISVTPEDVLAETVKAVFDTVDDFSAFVEWDSKIGDFLHDRRSECMDSKYLNIKAMGAERNE